MVQIVKGSHRVGGGFLYVFVSVPNIIKTRKHFFYTKITAIKCDDLVMSNMYGSLNYLTPQAQRKIYNCGQIMFYLFLLSRLWVR